MTIAFKVHGARIPLGLVYPVLVAVGLVAAGDEKALRLSLPMQGPIPPFEWTITQTAAAFGGAVVFTVALITYAVRDQLNADHLVAELRDRLAPKLEIVHGAEAVYRHHSVSGVTLRIGVRNTGGTSVEDVSVRLAACEPAGATLPETALRVKDENTPPYRTSFPVHPDQPVYIDVVFYEHGLGRDRLENARLEYVAPGVPDIPFKVPALPCKLTITAAGRNARARPKTFVADKDDPMSPAPGILLREEEQSGCPALAGGPA